MTDLQKIRKRLHKEMEILVDRTVDELTEETTPPARVPGDGQGPHEPVTPQRVEALLGEISAAYSRLGATKRKLSEAEGAVRHHEQRIRVEKRQLLTNAKNERVAGLVMDEALDTYPADLWRWCLFANAPESSDASFTWESFTVAVNKDLARTDIGSSWDYDTPRRPHRAVQKPPSRRRSVPTQTSAPTQP